MKALAIDFGGTHATCGLVEDQTILAHETIDTDRAKSLRAVLPQVVNVFHRLANTKGLSLTKCSAIAVGFAGLVHPSGTRVGNKREVRGRERDRPCCVEQADSRPAIADRE
jgi:predicted NBD/HSP70 family sugar kinase